MEWSEYLRFVFALAFVLALMGLLALLARRTGLGRMALGSGRRLALIELRSIDTRHKLALVKCDDREHLIVLGPQGQTVIDTNVTPAPSPVKAPE